MPNSGQGPGSDPPDDMGPSEEEVEDLAGGPGPDVSGDAFSQKVIKRLKVIGREEDRLRVLQAEHKAFRAKYCQAWSKNRTAMKPELLELEEKVKRQTLLLEKLKARSGALKEKFDNDQRFANQQSSSTSSADQPVTDGPAPSTSAPLPPDQDWESPVATGQEVEGEGGILKLIKQMESPLRADRLVFADEIEGIPEDERPCKLAKPVAAERLCYTKMDPSSMLSGEITDKMAADSKDTAMIPTEHQGMAAVEGGGDEQCVETSMDTSVGPAERNVMSAGSAASEKPVTPEDRTSSVSMNTAVKSAELCPVPSTDNTDRAKVLQEAGGIEGVNAGNGDTCVSVQRRRDSLPAAGLTNFASAGKSYASVLGGRIKEGGGVSVANTVRGFGGGIVGGFRRRNVVQLRWEGEGTALERGRVVELILEMGFRASDVFALISPSGSHEYDLSFMRPEGLDLFWERYRKCRDLPQWSGLVPKVVSRQPLIKLVTVMVRNESIPEADLLVWLRRFGEVLGPLRKVLDEHGIWTGVWTVSVKLGLQGNVVQHLPCSAFLGKDRLTIFYQGQPKVCNRCGDKGHFVSSCTLKKCSMCQGIGHLAKECTLIRCNLCQQLGHPYSQCPEALHNLPGLETELRRLDKEDEAAEAMEETVVPPSSVSVPPGVSESVSVSSSNVIPESVPSVTGSNVSVRRSSRLAEAVGGAGLVDLPPRPGPPPVPLPQRRKRGPGSVGGRGGDGVDGEDRGDSISHVSTAVEGVSSEQGWEGRKKKKKKRRTSPVICPHSDSDGGEIPLGNRFAVLSGDEMVSDLSISLSSMDEGESQRQKRAASGDECLAEVKKHLPQSLDGSSHSVKGGDH